MWFVFFSSAFHHFVSNHSHFHKSLLRTCRCHGNRSNRSFNLFPSCLALICPDVGHLCPAQTHLLLAVSDLPLVFKPSSPSRLCQCCCLFLCQPSALTLASLCSVLSFPPYFLRASSPSELIFISAPITIHPFITCTLAIFDVAKIKDDLKRDH